MQVNTNLLGQVQIDIDPINSAWGFGLGAVGHFFGQVAPNALRGSDTNYANVASALMMRGISVFNCP